MALAGRDTGALVTFSNEACRDEALLRLRDRVRVETDDTLKDTAARVEIRLADGSRLEADHDLDRPLPPADKELRLRAKAATLLGASRAETIWSAIDLLERSAVGPFAMILANP
jgi:hypothetical protein